MGKLGGWHRLWVVSSIILLLVVGSFSYILFPDSSAVSHKEDFYSQLSAKAKAQLALEDADKSSQVRMSNGHIILVREGIELRKSIPVFAEYENLIAASLKKQRVRFVGVALLTWVGLCAILYCFGWAVGWISRGFKAHESSP